MLAVLLAIVLSGSVNVEWSNTDDQINVIALPKSHSEKTNFRHRVLREAKITFDGNSMDPLPDNVMAGEKFTLTGKCQGFSSNKPITIKFVLYKYDIFSINKSDIIYSEILSSNIENDEKFSIELVIPSLNNEYYYNFIATQDRKSDDIYPPRIKISKRPILYNITSIDPEYTKGENIIINGSVYDENSVTIKYIFDKDPGAWSKDLNVVETNNQTVPFTGTIHTNRELLNNGPHYLLIYAEDQQSIKSEIFNFSFIYNDPQAPTLEVSKYDGNKTQYGKDSSIIFSISANDENYGDQITIYYKLDNGPYIEIFNLISTRVAQVMNYTYRVKSTPGKRKLTFVAKNNENSVSQEVPFDIEVLGEPSISITTRFEERYDQQKTITVTGYSEYFKAGSNVDFYYKLNNKEGEHMQISNDSTTISFTFTIQLPNEKQRNNITFYAKNENQSAESETFSFLTSNIPKLDVEIVDQKPSYVQNDTIKFKIQYKDFNTDQKVNVHMKVEGSDQVIHEYTFKGEPVTFYHTYTINKDSGNLVFTFVANDNELASLEQNVSVLVRKNPEIKITSALKPYYSPNDDLHITGFVTDYKEGITLSLKYQIDEFSKTELQNSIKINKNLSSDQFSAKINLHSDIGIHNIILTAVDSEGKSSEPVNLTIRIHDKPHLELKEFINEKYTNNDTMISMNVKITIHYPVSVYYSFDTSRETNLTSIEKSGEVKLQIPLNSNLSNDYHKVNVVLRDEFDLSSEVVSQQFVYYVPSSSPNSEDKNSTTQSPNSEDKNSTTPTNKFGLQQGFFSTPFGMYGLWILLVGLVIISVVAFFVVKAIINKSDRDSDSEFPEYGEDLNKSESNANTKQSSVGV